MQILHKVLHWVLGIFATLDLRWEGVSLKRKVETILHEVIRDTKQKRLRSICSFVNVGTTLISQPRVSRKGLNPPFFSLYVTWELLLIIVETWRVPHVARSKALWRLMLKNLRLFNVRGEKNIVAFLLQLIYLCLIQAKSREFDCLCIVESDFG